MRKTYASMCDARGVPTDFIREQLGHSSLATTYGYIYNPLTEEETYGALVRALSSKTEPEDNTGENIVDFPSKQHKNDLSPTCRQLSPRFRAKQKSESIDELYVSALLQTSAGLHAISDRVGEFVPAGGKQRNCEANLEFPSA